LAPAATPKRPINATYPAHHRARSSPLVPFRMSTPEVPDWPAHIQARAFYSESSSGTTLPTISSTVKAMASPIAITGKCEDRVPGRGHGEALVDKEPCRVTSDRPCDASMTPRSTFERPPAGVRDHHVVDRSFWRRLLEPGADEAGYIRRVAHVFVCCSGGGNSGPRDRQGGAHGPPVSGTLNPGWAHEKVAESGDSATQALAIARLCCLRPERGFGLWGRIGHDQIPSMASKTRKREVSQCESLHLD
jgi:hypothetical protein